MDGEITGDTDDLIGVSIIDNNGVEHVLDVRKKDGEITAHQQDGYPDKPAERSAENNEHVSQARRYAKYHVSQETEHDVLPWNRDQEAMQRTKEAIESLSNEAFEEYFGTYFDQINSRLPGVKAPLSEPDPVDDDQFILYMIDVYLNEDGQIDTTSDIHFLYLAENRERKVVFGEQPADREPDARPQIPPNFLTSFDGARAYFAYHLHCQIRDCYLLRGQDVPEQYRILGPGLYDGTTRYLREDRPYQPYHKPHAEIPGYSMEFDYGLGEQGKQAAKLASEIADQKEE